MKKYIVTLTEAERQMLQAMPSRGKAAARKLLRARILGAHLVALACQKPPEGRSRWTLRLLADRMVELEYVGQVSYQTVRRTLKKTNLSLG